MPNTCSFPQCGRPRYAQGLCQSHYRQLLKTGRMTPIRPYRKRRRNTVKYSGFRLSPECAGLLQRKSEREGLSKDAAIAAILEAWHRRGQRKK
jgi:hypothetical protein